MVQSNTERMSDDAPDFVFNTNDPVYWACKHCGYCEVENDEANDYDAWYRCELAPDVPLEERCTACPARAGIL